MKYEFIKMHGAGNDYVYIDCFTQEVDAPDTLSMLVSDRHKSIGGDGLVLICPSDCADARMRMFNADGSEGMMCGNAIRCVAKYVFDTGICRNSVLKIETKSGIREITVRSENGKFVSAAVDMGQAILRPRDIPMSIDTDSFISQPLTAGGKEYSATAVSMGNPHCVIFVDDTESLDLEKIGPDFENHPLFPDRVNTEFVQLIDEKNIRMRVWERGSGETMACGTGSCAAAVASVLTGRCRRDTPINVHLRGGILTDTWKSDGSVLMEGGANIVFRGTLDTDELISSTL